MAHPYNSELPAGIAAIVDRYLQRDPASLNSDWFGTLPVFGLLRCVPLGVVEAVPYAERWLAARMHADPPLDDEAFKRTYTGARSRVVRLRRLPVTTYAGFFGVAIACHELFSLTHQSAAAELVQDTADMVLHQVRRHGNGMVAHDDRWTKAIPDTCYFAVDALMHGAEVSATGRSAYTRQAVTQLRLYSQTFLDAERNIARTMLHLPDAIGTTYWSRASGWLMWAFCAVLRRLDVDHPDRPWLCDQLARFAQGISDHLGPDRCLHVHVDNHGSPPETTGTAMVAMGLNEAARCGWIASQFSEPAQQMWQFVQDQIHDDGSCDNVYTGWAAPAEAGQLDVATVSADGFSPAIGIVLLTAADFLTDRPKP